MCAETSDCSGSDLSHANPWQLAVGVVETHAVRCPRLLEVPRAVDFSRAALTGHLHGRQQSAINTPMMAITTSSFDTRKTASFSFRTATHARLPRVGALYDRSSFRRRTPAASPHNWRKPHSAGQRKVAGLGHADGGAGAATTVDAVGVQPVAGHQSMSRPFTMPSAFTSPVGPADSQWVATWLMSKPFTTPSALASPAIGVRVSGPGPPSDAERGERVPHGIHRVVRQHGARCHRVPTAWTPTSCPPCVNAIPSGNEFAPVEGRVLRYVPEPLNCSTLAANKLTTYRLPSGVAKRQAAEAGGRVVARGERGEGAGARVVLHDLVRIE